MVRYDMELSKIKAWSTLSLALLASVVLTGCQDDAEDKAKTVLSKKPQQIAKDLYDYQLPAEPTPPPPPPVEPPPEPEPMPAAIAFPDPRPLMREDAARTQRGLRRGRVNQTLAQAQTGKSVEQLSLTDPDYQQWEDASFEETKSTLPVDRSRILTADMRIPAILEDAVNSQIGGRMIAIVERDVLSPNGRFVLLPAYSRMICHYEALQEVGQSRLGVKCSRLIRPDGVSIALHDSTAADQAGRTGLTGDLDQRMWERYGAAFMVAGISALTQAGANVAKNQTINASTNQLSQNIGQITADVMERHLDLAPILSIPAGTRIQILPTTDIVLRRPNEKKQRLAVSKPVEPAPLAETTSLTSSNEEVF